MSGERWHAKPDGDGNTVIADENGLTIATVWGPEDDSNAERGDAQLLAAAPAMAEALQMLVDSSPGKQYKTWIPPQKILSAAMAALAEAGL